MLPLRWLHEGEVMGGGDYGDEDDGNDEGDDGGDDDTGNNYKD